MKIRLRRYFTSENTKFHLKYYAKTENEMPSRTPNHSFEFTNCTEFVLIPLNHRKKKLYTIDYLLAIVI